MLNKDVCHSTIRLTNAFGILNINGLHLKNILIRLLKMHINTALLYIMNTTIQDSNS